MDKVVSKSEFLKNEEFFVKEISLGKIFIYPTDTVYGIGCSTNSKSSILRVNQIKKRGKNKKLSIVVPNKKWIFDKCVVFEKHLKYIDKLPGAYTFIFSLKKKFPNCEVLNPIENSVGVRIIDNFFGEFCSKFGICFIATSCNLSGCEVVTSEKNIPKSVFEKVDYVIFEEKPLSRRSSTIIDLTTEDEKILRK